MKSGEADGMNKTEEFIAGIVPPTEQQEPAWWFAFQGNRLLIHPEASSASIPCAVGFAALGLNPLRQHYLGQLAGRHCYAIEVAEGTEPPAGVTFQGLRQVYTLVNEDLFSLAGRALQILDWDRTHQFCSRCGTPMGIRSTERAKECPRCGLLQFPRLFPAIIVRITRGHELLLARSRHFLPGLYSVIAGFVEPGETLEQAVAREVREEVGLAIKDIRYVGSQPWPFPHSLMIGFTATYAGGEIVLDATEIEDAGWFTADNLPGLPARISISRKLIDLFIEEQGKSPSVHARFVHTNLIAQDWRRLASFYEQVFGCVPVPPDRDLSGKWLEESTGVPGARIRGIHLRLPGYGEAGPTLEIFQYRAQRQRKETATDQPGFAHIAFEVDDIETARDGVTAAGGRVVGKPAHVDIPGAGRIMFVYVTDPEGNIIELQRWSG